MQGLGKGSWRVDERKIRVHPHVVMEKVEIFVWGAMNRKIHTSRLNTTVMLDPEFYGVANDYAIFPAGSGAATALISFQKGVTEANGSEVESIMRILIDKQTHIVGERYRAIKSLIEMLEYMKKGGQ